MEFHAFMYVTIGRWHERERAMRGSGRASPRTRTLWQEATRATVGDRGERARPKSRGSGVRVPLAIREVYHDAEMIERHVRAGVCPNRMLDDHLRAHAGAREATGSPSLTAAGV